MTRSIVMAATSIALVASMMNPGFAGNREYIENLQGECHALIEKFDATSTSNAEAKALRKKAFDNCAGGNADEAETAIKQMKQALELIGGIAKAK